MVAVVIFWAIVFALLCFALEVLLRTLSTGFTAFLESAGAVIILGVFMVLVMAVLMLVKGAIENFLQGQLAMAVFTFIFVVAILSVVAYFVGTIGVSCLAIVAYIVSGVLIAVIKGLDLGAKVCNRGYTKALSTVIKNVDRC